MLNHEILAERVRTRRRALGMTQEALAELAGTSIETIGRIEQAVGAPSLDTLYKVADALGTTGSALIAERVCDEVAQLIGELPEHEQEIARVMLRALSSHVRAQL